MAKKKKASINLPPNLRFKKPSKGLSNLVFGSTTFRSSRLMFGHYGIQAEKAGFVERGQIEAIRVALRRPSKKFSNSRVWVLVKPDRIVTKRSAETRMGRGKGSPFKHVAIVSKGQMLFEFRGPNLIFAKKIFEKARGKFSVPVNFVNTSHGSFFK